MTSTALLFFAQIMLILAQAGGGQKYGISWGVMILLVAVGLIVTLTPAKRTYEVKKPAEE